MTDSVIIMKVKNGYIVRPDRPPITDYNDNSEINVFETFNNLVVYLEMIFDFEEDEGDESIERTVEAGSFEAA